MLAVDQVIAIRHKIMVVENGGDRIVLEHVSAIRTAGVGARTRNQITAVRKLELKKTDRDGIEIEQRVRYRAGWTLNLYAAVRRCVIQVSLPIHGLWTSIARHLRAERRR